MCAEATGKLLNIKNVVFNGEQSKKYVMNVRVG